MKIKQIKSESVNEEDGEGGEEDAGRLDRTNQLAQNLLEKRA